MKHVYRQFLRLAGVALAFTGMMTIAVAQTYPTRPITIIVPFAPRNRCARPHHS
jgi:tripartite-type tricarboxylate transporter receptor subunit TctC